MKITRMKISVGVLAAVIGIGWGLCVAQSGSTGPERVISPRMEALKKMGQAMESTKPDDQTPAAGTARQTGDSRAEFLRTADFYLKSGELISGRVVSDDRNKVVVERRDGSKLTVESYGRRDIDMRSLQIKSMPAYRYYLDLGDYFAAQTWDFRDDPDDFISAIRSYEKAKRLLADSSGSRAERIAEIDEKIAELKADRDVWTRQVKSRAELRKLELVSEAEERFAAMEQKLKVSQEQLEESTKLLDSVLSDINSSQQRLEQGLANLEQDFGRRLSLLGEQVESNTRVIDPFNRGGYNYYRRNSYPYWQYNTRRRDTDVAPGQ